MSGKTIFIFLLLSLVSITCKETDTIYEPTNTNTLTDPSVKPAVIYTFPAANSVGPYDDFRSSFTMRFNKLMDFASLNHAIHFYSDLGDVRSDTSVLSINQGDVATITSIQSDVSIPFLWRVGKSYTLQIDSTAKDVNGNRLRSSYRMLFSPEPYFRVKSISPASGSVNVNTSTLQIAFNAPVDSLMRSRIAIIPTVDGLWHYVRYSPIVFDSSQIIFQNSSPFLPGSTYTVSISSTATDKNGDSLTGGFTSSFSTVSFGVISSNPSDGTVNWPRTSRAISISFSDSLDTATVRQAINISPATVGQLSYSTNFHILNYITSNNLLPDTVYTVSIDSSIHAKSGARLLEPYIFSFLTAPANYPTFRIYSTDPSNGDTNVTPQTSIWMYFSDSLDSATLRHGFSIVPALDGLITVQNGYLAVFSPFKTFALGTSYTVNLAANVSSLSGVQLGSPYSFSFKTTPFKVLGSDPGDGQTHIPPDMDIWVIATDTIDTSTIRGAFSINPPVAGWFSSNPSGNYFYFNPSTPLQTYTVYTVTISPALHSKSGMALASPYTFSFATGE